MEVERILTPEKTFEYLKSRRNITKVIEYLDQLKNKNGVVQINNDCIGLLMESLKIQSDLYICYNELPINNAELQLHNHILRVENKKLKEELEEALKLKL